MSYCVCGRNLQPRAPGVSPIEADILQRLETIRESRIAAACQSPPDLVTMASLDREASDLRARLTHLAHSTR